MSPQHRLGKDPFQLGASFIFGLAQDIAKGKAKQHELEERLTTVEHVMDKTYQCVAELRQLLANR